MSFRIIKPGFFTTIQDHGRWGYQSFGVPVSGAMDDYAMAKANLLVGNDENAAVLEFTLHGAEIELCEDVLVAFCGGGAHIFYDGKELPFNRPIHLRKGFLLKFALSVDGCRSYLAVGGGLKVPHQLNSAATYTPSKLGGFDGTVLKAGDVIHFQDQLSSLSKKIRASLPVDDNNVCVARWSTTQLMPTKRIRFIPGPEWDWFSKASQESFVQSEFSILPSSNRIGYKLKGEKIQSVTTKELISTAVATGVVQCTPDGSLIILMSDCQTTGGYPRIAAIAAADLPAVAQKRIGDTLQFAEVSFADAEQLLLEKHRTLREMKSAISTRFGV